MTIEELYWLAGLLEGEGTFHKHVESRGVVKRRINVASQDKDVIEKAARLMGVKCLGPYGPYGAEKRVRYQCCVVRKEAVIQLAATLRPCMSQRRQYQIDEMLI